MRIGTEKCPRRVGSDDPKPLTTICEEGVEIKGIRAYLRRVELFTKVEVVRRGHFLGSGPPLFPTNLRQQVRQSDNGPLECV